MRWLVAISCLVAGGIGGYAIGGVKETDYGAPWGDGPPEVANAFWDKVAEGGAASSVEPTSSCKEIGKQEFRCYARWSPVGQTQVFTYEGTVNVYPDGNIVVSDFDRQPETSTHD